MQVLENLQVTSSSCQIKNPLIPWTLILMCEFKHVQVTSLSCFMTSPCIPWTTLLMCVFQHFQVTSFSCFITSPFIPETTLLMCVFQHLQVTSSSCKGTSSFAARLCFLQFLRTFRCPQNAAGFMICFLFTFSLLEVRLSTHQAHQSSLTALNFSTT